MRLSCVLLEEQLEPLGATDVVVFCTPGHDVDDGFQMRPTMDVAEILRHIIGAVWAPLDAPMVGINESFVFIAVISVLIFHKGPHIRQHVALGVL